MSPKKDNTVQTALNTEAIDRIEKRIDLMPTKDETKLMFIEETRKLIDGMGGKIIKLESNQKWIIAIGGAVGGIFGRFVDKLF